MTQAKTKYLIDMLDTVQENLLALPDDMLLQIDPRDNESIKEGLEFITEYNDNLTRFSQLAETLKAGIRRHFAINPETEDIETTAEPDSSRDRIIQELDRSEPHSLEEDFTYKRPYGFVLGQAAVRGLKTWKSLYLNVLTELQRRDGQKFARLTTAEEFISSRGNYLFSDDHEQMRVAERVDAFGFYVEVNLSANHIRKNMQALLDYFGVAPEELKIYLREDRDA